MACSLHLSGVQAADAALGQALEGMLQDLHAKDRQASFATTRTPTSSVYPH